MKELSFDGLAQLFDRAAGAVPLATGAALEGIGKTVLARAQEKFGEYQGAAWPFPAWAPLAEATKADRVAHGFPEDEPLLRTGNLRSSLSFEVSPGQVEIGSNDEVMVYHEFGTSRMLMRPVLGPAVIETFDKWGKLLAGLFEAAFEYR